MPRRKPIKRGNLGARKAPSKPVQPQVDRFGVPLLVTSRPAWAIKHAIAVREGTSAYSPEMAGKICTMVSIGMTLAHVSEQPEMPSVRTMHRWLAIHPEFNTAMDEAIHARGEYWLAELMTLGDRLIEAQQLIESEKQGARQMVDHGLVNAVRVHSDNIKWALERIYPAKFSQTYHVHHAGHDGGPLVIPRTIDLTALDDEDLAKLADVLAVVRESYLENPVVDVVEDGGAGEERTEPA